MMTDKLDWTQKLGDAFLGQRQLRQEREPAGASRRGGRCGGIRGKGGKRQAGALSRGAGHKHDRYELIQAFVKVMIDNISEDKLIR